MTDTGVSAPDPDPSMREQAIARIEAAIVRAARAADRLEQRQGRLRAVARETIEGLDRLIAQQAHADG